MARIEWNYPGQPERPGRRSSRVISVRRIEFFQPIAVLAAVRYWGGRDHVFALVAEDLERFVEDRLKLGEDRAGGVAVCSGRMIARRLKISPLHAIPERISG